MCLWSEGLPLLRVAGLRLLVMFPLHGACRKHPIQCIDLNHYNHPSTAIMKLKQNHTKPLPTTRNCRKKQKKLSTVHSAWVQEHRRGIRKLPVSLHLVIELLASWYLLVIVTGGQKMAHPKWTPKNDLLLWTYLISCHWRLQDLESLLGKPHDPSVARTEDRGSCDAAWNEVSWLSPWEVLPHPVVSWNLSKPKRIQKELSLPSLHSPFSMPVYLKCEGGGQASKKMPSSRASPDEIWIWRACTVANSPRPRVRFLLDPTTPSPHGVPAPGHLSNFDLVETKERKVQRPPAVTAEFVGF